MPNPKGYYHRQRSPPLGDLVPEFLQTQTCFQVLKCNPNTQPGKVHPGAMDGSIILGYSVTIFKLSNQLS
jgi:hypothetical protein